MSYNSCFINFFVWPLLQGAPLLIEVGGDQEPPGTTWRYPMGSKKNLLILRGADWLNLRIGSAENIFFFQIIGADCSWPLGGQNYLYDLGSGVLPLPRRKEKGKITPKGAKNGTFSNCHKIQTVVDINLKIGLVVHWDEKIFWCFIKLVIRAQWGATGPQVSKT